MVDRLPDKYVILVDTDGKEPERSVSKHLKEELPNLLGSSVQAKCPIRIRTVASGSMVLCRRDESQEISWWE